MGLIGMQGKYILIPKDIVFFKINIMAKKSIETSVDLYKKMSFYDHNKYVSSLDINYMAKHANGKVYTGLDFSTQYIKESHDKYYLPLLKKLPFLTIGVAREICDILQTPENCEAIINSNHNIEDFFQKYSKDGYVNICDYYKEFNLSDSEVIKDLLGFKPASLSCINIGAGEIAFCLLFNNLTKIPDRKNGDLIDIKTGKRYEMKGNNGKISPYGTYKISESIKYYQKQFNKSIFFTGDNEKKNGNGKFKNESIYIDSVENKITEAEGRYKGWESAYQKNCETNYDFNQRFILAICEQYKINIENNEIVTKFIVSFKNIKCFDENSNILKENFDKFDIIVSSIATCIKEQQDYIFILNENTGDVFYTYFNINNLTKDYVNTLYDSVKYVKITGYPSIDERCEAIKVMVNIPESINEK